MERRLVRWFSGEELEGFLPPVEALFEALSDLTFSVSVGEEEKGVGQGSQNAGTLFVEAFALKVDGLPVNSSGNLVRVRPVNSSIDLVLSLGPRLISVRLVKVSLVLSGRTRSGIASVTDVLREEDETLLGSLDI